LTTDLYKAQKLKICSWIEKRALCLVL